MIKIKLLVVAIVILLIGSCKGTSQEEKDVNRYCECASKVGMLDMVIKVKATPELMNQKEIQAEMKTLGEEFELCVDLEEIAKREKAMDPEAKEIYSKKVKELIGKSCPEVAKAMGVI